MTKKGFTLAEVLVTLTVLGIIAVITVPSLIRKQQETVNRTSIRKALSMYEKVIENVRLEQNFADVDTMATWTKGADDSCSNIKKFFKIKEDNIGKNSCTFTTNDGVYWDVSNLKETVVSVAKDDTCRAAAKANAAEGDACYNKTFIFTVENSSDGKYFVVNKSDGNACYALKYTKLLADNATCKGKQCYQTSSCNDGICKYKTYDENGNMTSSGSKCTGSDISSCSSKNRHVYTYDSNGNITSEGSKCSGSDISSCTTTKYYTYTFDSKGNKTSDFYCTKSDCSSKNYYTYYENGNMKAQGNYCTGNDISSCSLYYAYDENGNKTAQGSNYCTVSDISNCYLDFYMTYDKNGNETSSGSKCTGKDISSCTNKNYYTYDENGNMTSSGSFCASSDINSCTSKKYYAYTFDTNGNKTAECSSVGKEPDINNCSSSRYNIYTYDSNGNITGEGSKCLGSDISSCEDVTSYTYECK